MARPETGPTRPETGPTRPETGPMQFPDDWTGIFIRGDDAHRITGTVLMAIVELRMWQQLKKEQDIKTTTEPDPFLEGLLLNLSVLLQSCNHYTRSPEDEAAVQKAEIVA